MDSSRASRKIVRNVGWSILSKVAVFSLKFVSVPILARLLTPAEFGIVATGMIVVFFLLLIGGAGLSAGLIRAEREDPETQDTVFWTNLTVASVLGILLYFNAAFVAGLLGAPEAKWLLEIFAFLFPIYLGADVASSILSRRMAFAKDAFWNVVSEALGAIAAIAAALGGLGVWALILQQFVSAIVRWCGLMFASRYVPRFRFSSAKLRALFGYGSRIAGADFANFISFQSPLVVITRILGLSDAGAFSVANRLSDLPNQIVLSGLMGVLFPAFSTMADQPERRSRVLMQSTQMTSILLAPMLFGFGAVAEPAMNVVFGAQWTYAWPVLGLLAVAKGIMTPCGSFIPFLKATGHAGVLWWFALARAAVIVVGTWIGATLDGLIGVCLALCIANVFIMIGYAAVVFNVAKIPMRAAVDCVILPLGSAVAMAALVRILLGYARPHIASDLLLLLAGAAAGTVIYLLLMFATQRGALTSLLALRR
ncbi:lipopolysaccharide biosynthesis protein [Phyllobacterium phragmitis]|uniref:Lipopolysaccharide biosynthesis protein n=1 Tax=Phyllobacterium phragmitis TaxID=2670329 RepID=A0A2S9IPU2_9HYPH|nr:lipopolysaccharide biosynthesis protein [Phyllobacterium phragmitis]PRD42551.1 lipopolysaccharide biosynthesis protein [Phyllobacterium phragmitis]